MTLWYLARAAGFVALLAATASVALGALASVDGPTTRAAAIDGSCASSRTGPPRS